MTDTYEWAKLKEKAPLQRWIKLHLFFAYQSPYKTTELAKWLGVNRRTIQRWVKGLQVPSDVRQLQIEDYLMLVDK